MKSLNYRHLRMPRLKDQAPSVLIKTDMVVCLTGRIDKPRLRFLRDRTAKVEAQGETTRRSTQILHFDALQNRPLFSGKKHSRGESQIVDRLVPHHTMGKPLIFDGAIWSSRDGDKATIHEQFACQ